MWYKREIVALVFKADSLLLFWLQRSKKERVVIPRAWQHYAFDMMCLDRKSLYNSSYIASCIRAFLQHNKLSHAYITCAFNQELLWQEYLWYGHDENTSDGFFSNPHQLLWNYCIISTQYTDQRKLIYKYGISRPLLFQFQLLALRVPFNCIFVSSLDRALLQVIFTHNAAATTLQYNQAVSYTQQYNDVIETFNYQFQTNASSFFDLFSREKESVYAAVGLYTIGKQA